MVQNEILSRIQSKDLKVYVIWTPVLKSDDRLAAVASTKNLNDPRAEHYWDADQSLARQFGITTTLPDNLDLAWDIYFVFDKNVLWKTQLPDPVNWMHQLSSDERRLNGTKLRQSVEAVLETPQ